MTEMSSPTAVSTVRGLTIGAALLVGSGVVTGLANLIFNVIVARAGGSVTYGAIGPLLAVSTVVGFLSNGVMFAVARQVALHPHHARHVVLSQGLRMWPLWLFTAVSLAVIVPVQHYLGLSSPVPVIVAALIWITMLFGALPTAGAVGTSRLRLLAGVALATTALRLALGVIAGHSGNVGTTALVASLIPVMATALILFLALGRTPRTTPLSSLVTPVVTQAAPPAAVSLGGASLVAAIASAGLWALWSAPLLLARHDLSHSVAGSFAAAQLIMTGCMLITGSVITAFYGEIARRGGRLIAIGAAATVALMMAATLFLVLLGPFIVGHLYGAGFVVQRTWFAAFGISGTAAALANFAMWSAWARRRNRFTVSLAIALGGVTELVIVNLTSATPAGLALAPALALITGGLLATGLTTLSHSTTAMPFRYLMALQRRIVGAS